MTYAIVKPANIPPRSTSASATLKYIHSAGSSGDASSPSPAAVRLELNGSARARRRGRFIRPMIKTFAKDPEADRLPRGTGGVGMF
jgi:hypothetical protein